MKLLTFIISFSFLPVLFSQEYSVSRVELTDCPVEIMSILKFTNDMKIDSVELHTLRGFNSYSAFKEHADSSYVYYLYYTKGIFKEQIRFGICNDKMYLNKHEFMKIKRMDYIFNPVITEELLVRTLQEKCLKIKRVKFSENHFIDPIYGWYYDDLLDQKSTFTIQLDLFKNSGYGMEYEKILYTKEMILLDSIKKIDNEYGLYICFEGAMNLELGKLPRMRRSLIDTEMVLRSDGIISPLTYWQCCNFPTTEKYLEYCTLKPKKKKWSKFIGKK